MVACSFADRKVRFDVPFKGQGGRLLLGNYDDAPSELEDVTYLQPYEGRAYVIG